MMFKIYLIDNYTNVKYLDHTSQGFELTMVNIRSMVRRHAIKGWQIARASDGVILAESKRATS